MYTNPAFTKSPVKKSSFLVGTLFELSGGVKRKAKIFGCARIHGEVIGAKTDFSRFEGARMKQVVRSTGFSESNGSVRSVKGSMSSAGARR